MISGLKPYLQTKGSGVPWLGEVPEHWSVERLKSSITNVIEQTEQTAERRNGDLYIALEHVESWTGRLRPTRPDVTFDSQVKRFRGGDVLFGKLRPYLAKVIRAPSEGVCVGEFLVLRPSVSYVCARYVEKLLRSKPVIDAVNSSTFGAKMPRADWQFMGSMSITLPPLPEQAAIVRFLNHADRRIRRYIRAKQKLIKLLEEQKQAIVHRAVTRGVDPNVRLKPSGVEWLGGVPEHWEIRRAKAVCSAIVDCKNRTPDAIDGGSYLIVRTTCVRGGRFDPAGGYATDEDNFRIWTARGAPRHGDVFFTREAPAGEACLVPDRADLCMGQRMMYFRPDPELLDSEFLLLSMYGPLTRTYVEQATNGSTVGHLRLGQVYALPVLWCPLEEQRAIVRYVRDATEGLERTQRGAEQEIDLLREYRTRLIADVVTGKLDVREAAARLPEEAEELEPLDEAEALGELDAESAADDLEPESQEAEA